MSPSDGDGAGPPGVGSTVELAVDSIAGGGDGVARDPAGRVVFVPRTAPGDRVRARIETEKGSWARAEAVELLEPGPDRAAAPCPYYPACGGCQLQHLDAVGRRRALGRMVRDALERIGGLADVEVSPPVAAGPEFGYRNRITLTLRREGDPPTVVAGYRHHADPDRVLDVEDCPLAEAPVRRAWSALRAAWGAGAEALPAGPELRLTVRASEAGRVSLVAAGGDPDRPGEPGRLAAAIDEAAALSGIHWRDRAGARRLLAGERRMAERWNGLEVRLLPEAFLQVNRRVSAAIDRHLTDGLAPLDGLRIVDLYAGVGVRGIGWALAGARVVAVERDGDAVRSGRDAAERAGARVDFRAARVEDAIDAVLPADRVVLNPPRGGLSRPVSRRLAEGGAPRLVYVSCDPATLARDLARLGDGWRLDAVRTFDAFPQTAHVETVAWLTRAAAGERPGAPA